MKHFALRFLFSCVGIAAGVYFRDFWRSDLGPPTFIFLVFFTTTVVMSWQLRSKPRWFLIGLIFGLAIAIPLTITWLVNLYVGMAILILFLILALKARFFEQ